MYWGSVAEQDGEARVWPTRPGGEVVDDIDAMLGGGAHDAHYRPLSTATPVGAGATPDFSGHHSRADALLGSPVRSVVLFVAEEAEHRRGFFGHVGQKSAHRFVAGAC